MDERGIVGGYLRVLAIVAIVGFAWIILNMPIEQTVQVAENTGLVSDEGSGVTDLLMVMWRLFPIVIFIAAAIWALARAHKREPYVEELPGYYGG